MEPGADPNVTIDRMDKALLLLAGHIQRHMDQRGDSPFLAIFERLEAERDTLIARRSVVSRVQALLAQSAMRPSHSARVSNVAPDP